MIRTLLLSVIGVAVLVVAAAFAWLNPGDVTLDLGVGVYELPLAYVVITVFAVGWLFGLVAASVWVFRAAGERRRAARELRLAEAEVANLRRMPDADAG
jgi:uncharacterized integral membrane protein